MSELADAPWAPIFAEARATTTTTPPLTTMCWSKEARVVLPVAVPPPWTGTATIVASPGCTRATELRSKGVFWALWLEADGATPASITVTTEVRRGEVVAARWAWSSDRASFAADGVGLSLGMSERWVLFGDALRYAPEGRDLESTFDGFRYEGFWCDTGITLEELIRATAASPYAGIGVNLSVCADQGPIGTSIPAPPDFGPPTADRRAALATVDPARLTPWQRKVLTELLQDRPLRPAEDRVSTCPRRDDR